MLVEQQHTFDMSSNYTVNDNEENWKHWAMKRCKMLTL